MPYVELRTFRYTVANEVHPCVFMWFVYGRRRPAVKRRTDLGLEKSGAHNDGHSIGEGIWRGKLAVRMYPSEEIRKLTGSCQARGVDDR
jgi:hypothetical protein